MSSGAFMIDSTMSFEVLFVAASDFEIVDFNVLTIY